MRGRSIVALCISAYPGLVQAQPAAAPYALPWRLRPAGPSNVVRLDSVLALSEAAGAGAGHTLRQHLIGLV